MMDHCGSIVLVRKVDARLNDCCNSEDFRRFPNTLSATLMWKEFKKVGRLIEALRECKVPVYLDLEQQLP